MNRPALSSALGMLRTASILIAVGAIGVILVQSLGKLGKPYERAGLNSSIAKEVRFLDLEKDAVQIMRSGNPDPSIQDVRIVRQSKNPDLLELQNERDPAVAVLVKGSSIYRKGKEGWVERIRDYTTSQPQALWTTPGF